MELIEFRDDTKTMTNLISVKIKNIEENEAQVFSCFWQWYCSTSLQILEVDVSLVELRDRFMANEAEVMQLENCLREEQEANEVITLSKCFNDMYALFQAVSEEILQTLEREVEEVCNRLSDDTIRADVMEKMFFDNGDVTLHESHYSLLRAFNNFLCSRQKLGSQSQ